MGQTTTMATETKTITLENYISIFVSTFDDGFSSFNTKDEEVSHLVKKQSKEMKSKFEKFASAFCENKNRMDKGVYEFVSCDGNTFVYTIAK